MGDDGGEIFFLFFPLFLTGLLFYIFLCIIGFIDFVSLHFLEYLVCVFIISELLFMDYAPKPDKIDSKGVNLLAYTLINKIIFIVGSIFISVVVFIILRITSYVSGFLLKYSSEIIQFTLVDVCIIVFLFAWVYLNSFKFRLKKRRS